MTIKLEQAKLAVDAAQARAAELGIRVTVAIVDGGGLLVQLSRMDGAPTLSPEIAEAKAVGAAVLQRSGDQLAEVWEKRPGFFAAVNGLARRPIVPGLGSIPIRDSEGVAGAIGVSGGRPEEDHDCAEAAIAALGAGRPA